MKRTEKNPFITDLCNELFYLLSILPVVLCRVKYIHVNFVALFEELLNIRHFNCVRVNYIVMYGQQAMYIYM